MDAITAPPTNIKPGVYSSEFWVTILATIASIGGQIAGFIPPPYGMIVGAIATAAYSISRGLAKGGQLIIVKE